MSGLGVQKVISHPMNDNTMILEMNLTHCRFHDIPGDKLGYTYFYNPCTPFSRQYCPGVAVSCISTPTRMPFRRNDLPIITAKCITQIAVNTGHLLYILLSQGSFCVRTQPMRDDVTM